MSKVNVDLAPQFIAQWLEMPKADAALVLATLQKLKRHTWQQVQQSKGFHWEEVSSLKPPAGLDKLHTLRVNDNIRIVALRQGDFMRCLGVGSHVAVYGD
jgi:hypothetical protein